MKLYKDNNTSIFNPATGRYVKLTGQIGRRLERMTDEQYNALAGNEGAGAGVEEGGVKEFSADRSKIRNPGTGRMVSVTGAIGRKLVRMNNDEYTALAGAGAGAPKARRKPKEKTDLKRVVREEQAKAIVRGVMKADEYMQRFREQTARLFDELPSIVVDIPTNLSLRKLAKALINGDVNELESIAEDVEEIGAPTTLQLRPEPGQYLDILLQVADTLDEIIEQIEEESKTDLDNDILEDIVIEQMQAERFNQLEETMNDYRLFDPDQQDESDWNNIFNELYELEPVEDDRADYKAIWQSGMEQMRENARSLFGSTPSTSADETIQSARVEQKKSEDDELTRLLGYADEDEDEEKAGFEEQKGDDEPDEEQWANIMDELSLEDPNLERLMNTGRGAYTSTTSVPDPHMSAFDHINMK